MHFSSTPSSSLLLIDLSMMKSTCRDCYHIWNAPLNKSSIIVCVWFYWFIGRSKRYNAIKFADKRSRQDLHCDGSRAAQSLEKGGTSLQTMDTLELYRRWWWWWWWCGIRARWLPSQRQLFEITSPGQFSDRSGVCRDYFQPFLSQQTLYFRPKHDLFLTLTRCFFVPKPNQISITELHKFKRYLCDMKHTNVSYPWRA